jgi:hypothetical protein
MSPTGIDQRGGSLRDGRVKNWFWCDNALFEMGLGKHALVVYLYLCRVAGDSDSCWPSLKKISLATKWPLGGLGHDQHDCRPLRAQVTPAPTTGRASLAMATSPGAAAAAQPSTATREACLLSSEV